MSKFCIFCGCKPESKTKEHVVPRWLIELTGDPKRQVYLGLEKSGSMRKREFSFDQFSFPACNKCNNKYAELEGKAKNVLISILEKQTISPEDFNTFLDWLDKVRIGLWLGMIQLDKNYAGIEPSFHIETRMGQYDRMLIVEKSDSTRCKLNFGGTDTLSFTFGPSAFTLIVNNYYFTNISYMFLIHRRLGFPYPASMQMSSTQIQANAKFVEGSRRIMLPLLRRPISEKGAVFYQPRFGGNLTSKEHMSLYDDYAKSHCLNFEQGIGNIFEDASGELIEHKLGSSISLEPKKSQKDDTLYIQSAINIYEWQNWLITLVPSFEKLSKEHRDRIKKYLTAMKKINNILIKHHKSILKSK
ncbi:hypothetical protein [Pseudomonas yamanorum]|uniref:hypothetical protein n=1 Tax=Pseudomonas yamanorum TaxID=515393 RepID=UPI003BA02557